MIALTAAGAGILPTFWTLPTAFLSGAAAGGIALIDSIGNLAGFAGPYAVGLLKDATGSYTPDLLTLTAAGQVGTLGVLLLPQDPSLKQPPGDDG